MIIQNKLHNRTVYILEAEHTYYFRYIDLTIFDMVDTYIIIISVFYYLFYSNAHVPF